MVKLGSYDNGIVESPVRFWLGPPFWQVIEPLRLKNCNTSIGFSLSNADAFDLNDSDKDEFNPYRKLNFLM